MYTPYIYQVPNNTYTFYRTTREQRTERTKASFTKASITRASITRDSVVLFFIHRIYHYIALIPGFRRNICLPSGSFPRSKNALKVNSIINSSRPEHHFSKGNRN